MVSTGASCVECCAGEVEVNVYFYNIDNRVDEEHTVDMNYFNRKGKVIDSTEWGRLLSDDSYRLIQSDTLGEVHVSTVWLGLNHNWGDGPPLIFETMIFGGPLDEDQWRYSTEKEAKAGHAAAVQAIRDIPAELQNPEWHGDKLYGTCSKCGKLVQANKKVGSLHVCI